MGLWTKPKSKWLLGIPLGGLLAILIGVIGWNIFMGVMHTTSTTEFCASCHTQIDTVVEEYEASIHFKNQFGVRAECQDCHLADDFIPYMFRKIEAVKEVVAFMRGDITKDNFEEHRGRMAEKVWAEMIENDSRECRSCHKADSMDFTVQKRSVARRHKTMEEKGKTCVDCHQGVAHTLPEIEI